MILGKKNNTGGITLPNFTTHYKARGYLSTGLREGI
jgi:hypothetical protein